MLRVEIETDNAAFERGAARECARILKDIAERLRAGETDGRCRDVNGNTVGRWSLAKESGR